MIIAAMNADTIARWQFAVTTLYHYLFVPLTIGISLFVAVMQTLAYRNRGTDKGRLWDDAARFWGSLMLVIFAIGVVTGIVQEFQFGMNWSSYSRFVGDIFGAPLAMEGLIAFFLESTFLGLWIFGRDVLSARVHLATIWLAAAGSTISAYFILAANSFMQHPVGYHMNPQTGRAELTSIWAVLSNSTQLVTFPHTLLAAFASASALLVSVSAWHIRKSGTTAKDVHVKVLELGAVTLIVAAIGVSAVGHIQGQIMVKQQPMKMAAAEAMWETRAHAPFSLFAYGDVTHGKNKIDIGVPDGVSLLATNSAKGTVQGINAVQAQEAAKYGPGNYKPIIGLAYWTFRLMIGAGLAAALVGVVLLWQARKGRLVKSRKILWLATFTVALPQLANLCGWAFTETGRQPWLVYGLLLTHDGVSTTVGNSEAAVTLIGFTALYGVLAVIAVGLFLRIAGRGIQASEAIDDDSPDGYLSMSTRPSGPDAY